MTHADRRVAMIVAIAALAAAPSGARAQSAEAEALFREGRELMKEGKAARACGKFDASERLESTVGTLLNLGDCREKLGQLASAWLAFRKAEALARRSGDDGDRESEARRRAAKLQPKLSFLTIDVPAESRVRGMSITRNGVVIERALWSTQIPVDPGDHKVEVYAEGYEPWSAVVTVKRKAKRLTVFVPPLIPLAPPTPIEEPIPPTIVEIRRPAPPPPERQTGHWTGTRKASIAIGVVGVAVIGGGVAYGLHAQDLEAQADARCPDVVCPDPEGLRLNQEAEQAALRANILYGVGAIAVVGAITMWVVGGPDEYSVAPVAGADQVGVSVARSF